MKKILLSIIVTVYNVEQYIPKCIESIINQTYPNIEVILIDDGSIDGSGIICDRYVDRDERIISIHKKNEGIISARYQGVRCAKGSLIAFVDGDDWIESNMYECMISAYEKEKVDMITTGLTFEWKDRKRILLNGIEEGLYDKESIENKILKNLACCEKTNGQGITASVCNKLFNRSLLSSVMQTIDKQLTLGEDGAIVYSYIEQANKIMVINKSWYHYIQHNESMIRSYDLKSFEKIYRLKKCLEKIYKQKNDIKVKAQIDYYIKSFLWSAIEHIYEIKINSVIYIFPYESIPKGSKIILYGAGKVGDSYRNCLIYGEYAEVVSWVDRDYLKLQSIDMPVESLENAIYKDFDYVVIAIENKESAVAIKKNLISQGIPSDKIIWKRPKRIL